MPKYSVSVMLTFEEYAAPSPEQATEAVKQQIPDCGSDNRVQHVFILLKQPGWYFATVRLCLNEVEAPSPQEAVTQVKQKLSGGKWDKQRIDVFGQLWGPFHSCGLVASEGTT